MVDVPTTLWCMLAVVALGVLGVLWLATKKDSGDL